MGGLPARRASLEHGRGVAETLERSRFPLTDGVLRQLKGLGGAEFLLIGPGGRVEASTLADVEPGSTDPLGNRPISGRSWNHSGTEYWVESVARTLPPDPGRLLVLTPESTLRAAAWEARRGVLILTALGAGLAVMVGSWIGGTLSRPLSAILGAIREVGRGNLEPGGLPTGRGDEIGELADGVDQMARWLRRLQADRARTERLRLIRQVSAGLAHEIRNPLTAARMTLQLFIERNGDRDSEPLRIALSELERTERQIRRFLQLTRPDPPRFEPSDLDALLVRCASGISATAEHRGIGLEVALEPGLPPASIDAEQIGQVVTNLLANAIDAAGPGGHVRLSASIGPDGGPRIMVEDDGPGVDPESEPRLFSAFHSTKPEGVGLGLALARALVGEHGGTLHYERIDGRTRFQVALPSGCVGTEAPGLVGLAV